MNSQLIPFKKKKPNNLYLVLFWNRHKFKIIVSASILAIFVFWWIDDDNPGTFSKTFHYQPLLTLKKPAFTRKSKGELECRRVLEKLLKSPFPSIRPQFLQNRVTGHPLEIDCFNESLRLGCEYNGKQHYEYTKAFHKNYEAFRNQQYRDDMKYRACEDAGIKLIIVPYSIQHDQIENYIRDKLQSLGYRL